MKKKLFFLFLCALISANLFGQSVIIEPIANPSVIIRTQEANFKANLRNLDLNSSASNLTIEAVAPAGFIVYPSSKPVPTIGPDGSVVVDFTVVAYCNAPQVGGQITYTLKDAANTVLYTYKSYVITITEVDFIFEAGASFASTHASGYTEYSRIWALTQTAPLASLTDVRITNTCDKSTIVMTKVELVDDIDGTNVLWNITGASSVYNGGLAGIYRYTFGSDVFLYYGNGDATFDEGETVYVKETFRITKCISEAARYSFENGDGTNWCLNPNIFSTQFSVLPITYDANILATMSQIAPTSSDGKFTYLIRFRNPNTNPDAILRNVALNTNGAYPITPPMTITRAYFADAAGNPISGFPDILTNITTNTTVNFNFTNSDYEALGLTDEDGDGYYNDMKPGATFYIKYEVEYNFSAYPQCGSNVMFNNYRDHRLNFFNNCNVSQSSNTAWPWYSHLGYNALQNIVVSPPSVPSITGNHTLTFYETQTNRTDEFSINTNNYNHWVNIMLPEGFDYNTALQGVRVNNVLVPIANVIRTVDTDGRVWLNIFLKGLFTNMSATMYYSIIMFVLPEGNNDMDKTIRVEHEFGFLGESERYSYSCRNSGPLNLNWHKSTGCISHFAFDVQRCTFGYTNASKTTRITMDNINTQNVDRTVAGPWDNVDWGGGFALNCPVFLDPLQNWIVNMEYREPTATGVAFYFPDPDKAVTITRIFADNSPSQVFYLPIGDVSEDWIGSGMNRRRILHIDLTPYTLRATPPLLNMEVGDVVWVNYNLQTTDTMPANITLVYDISMRGYIENGAPDDFTVRLQNFWVVDYATIEMNRNGVDFFENTSSIYDFNRSNSGVKSIAEIFPREFRPNQYAVKYEYIFNDIMDITAVRQYEQLLGESPGSTNVILTPDVDYTVTTDASTTTLSITKPFQTEFVNGVFFRTGISLNMACYKQGTYRAWVDFNVYPTSEKSNIIKRASTPINSTIFNTAYLYTFNISTVQPTSYPLADEVLWNFTLNNTSQWRGSDGKMPNSWISIEIPDGFFPDNPTFTLSDGSTTWTDFVYYGVGTLDGKTTRKYWVKMGEITVNTTTTNKNFTISGIYSSCKAFTVRIIYGMSKMGYPESPSIQPCPRSSTLTLFAIPTLNALRGTVISPPYDGSTGYTFCTEQTFRAIHTNTQVSELYYPVLKMILRRGLELNHSSVVATQNGVPINIISITDSGPDTPDERVITIVLDSTTVFQPFGTSFNEVEVEYSLRPVCGYRSGYVSLVTFLATNPCQEELTETKSTAPINIDGVNYDSEYYIPAADYFTYDGGNSLNLSTPNDFADAFIQIDATIVMASSIQSFGDYIAITIPPNMTIQCVNHTFVYQNMEEGNLVYHAPMPVMQQGDTEVFTAIMKPINPELWTCDEVTATIYTGVFIPVVCETNNCNIEFHHNNKKSQTFSVKKNEVTFHSAIGTGTYNDAHTEKVMFSGMLNVPTEMNMDSIVIEVFSHRTGAMVPLGVSFNIYNVITDEYTIEFPYATTTPLIVPAEEICNLYLVIRKTTDYNQYLCDSVAILVPPPSYTLASQTYETCVVADLVVGDAAITGYSYSWNPTTYIVGSSSTTPITVNYPATLIGHQTLNVTVNRGGCAVGTSATVSLIPRAIDVNIVLSDKTICEGENVSLVPHTTITDSIFYWYNAAGTLLHTGYTFDFTALTKDTTLFVGVEGTGYCENIPATRKEVNVFVTLKTTPTFNFPLAIPYCIDDTPVLLPTSSTNSTPITGTWSPSTITTDSAGTTLYTFTPDAGQCTNDVTISITVKICTLLDCNDMIDRTEEEDYYLAGIYTHSGTDWDAVPLMILDSIKYFINGALYSEGQQPRSTAHRSKKAKKRPSAQVGKLRVSKSIFV